MLNLNLGKYFTLNEMCKSITAKRLNLLNSPGDYHIVNMLYLTQYLLDPIREAYGKPIIITSGYRSQELNKAIGGSSGSQHSNGQAVDIECSTGYNGDLFNLIYDSKLYDQLIWEFGDDQSPDWIHVSWNSTLRGDELQAIKEDGKVRYVHYG